MITSLTVGCLGVIGAGYHVATRLSRASIRRREARALRAILLGDIETGRRSREDPAVQGVLAWVDTVAGSGRAVPLESVRSVSPAGPARGPDDRATTARGPGRPDAPG